MGGNRERAEEPLMGVQGEPKTELFEGYDSVSGKSRSSAVRATPVQTGPKTTARIAVCEGMSELSEALNIDQSLAVELAKSGEIDEKVKFVREQKATAESLSILVQALHQDRIVTARDPVFTADFKSKGVATFVDEYGDSYVQSYAVGGEYYAVYTFLTQTVEERNKLKGELSAKGVRAGSSVELKTVMELDRFSKSSSTASVFDQRVSGVKAELPTPEKMADFCRTFSTLNFEKGMVVDRKFAPYEKVQDFPFRDGFAPVVENRRYFRGTEGGGLTGALVRIMERKNKVEWIKTIHGHYGFKEDEAALNAIIGELDRDRKAIEAQLDEYDANPLRKFAPLPLPSLAAKTPKLTYQKGTTNRWGWNSAPRRVDYPNVEQAVNAGVRLVSVRLRGSNLVDKIAMVYRDKRGGGWDDHIGGDGGGGRDQGELSLDSNEFIARVECHHGELVDWLTITTTAGKSIWAGGKEGGEHKDGLFEAKDGKVLLGFQGTGGVDVNTLEVVWVKLMKSELV
jgi:hypothetical protein